VARRLVPLRQEKFAESVGIEIAGHAETEGPAGRGRISGGRPQWGRASAGGVGSRAFFPPNKLPPHNKLAGNNVDVRVNRNIFQRTVPKSQVAGHDCEDGQLPPTGSGCAPRHRGSTNGDGVPGIKPNRAL